LLLVLDNCGQIVGTASLAADVMAARSMLLAVS
jgi:hypothetical protein